MKPSTDILGKLAKDGWAIFESESPYATESTLSALGPIVQKTRIAPRPDARAALATDLEMELHTDHPRVHWIGWHCMRQSSEGGASLLKDARRALSTLSSKTRITLTEITLGSHQVFECDHSHWPIVRDYLGIKDWIYFTPWLCSELANPDIKGFIKALDQVETQRVILKHGEVLLIDNTRMLHGRSAISGDKNRLLIRYWIGHPKDNFNRTSDCKPPLAQGGNPIIQHI